MLRFIKNIFAKKELPEEKISLDELDSWLEQRAKPVFEGIDAQINEIIGRINNEKSEAGEKLKILEAAQLQNPKIPERVKIIMQGNREAFIRKTSFFFSNINLDHSSYGELIEKCNTISKEVDIFGKSTAKSYHILNEFFAREAEKVAASIKAVENCSNGLASAINGSKIKSIESAKSNISGLKNKIKLKESYSSQLERDKTALQSNKSRKTEIEKKIDELKSGHGYKNYEKLLEEKEKAGIKIKEIENGMFHGFSVLEKALKKYAKIAFEDENLILEYLESPIAALVKDDELKILKILGNLKISIESDKLGLEEKKKEKSIEKISGLDRAYLSKIRDDSINAKKMLDGLAAEIKNSSSKKNLDSLSEELKNILEGIEKADKEILALNKELEKINIEKLREDLQNEINGIAGIRITVL